MAVAIVVAISVVTVPVNAAGENKGGSLLNRIVKAISGSSANTDEYKSPVDFKYYQKKNPDIYAWIEIPGTDIDHPLVQNDDDSYYIRRGWDRKKSTKGSLFTESTYNGKDFSDPVTVIYGHRTNDESMFGQLQKVYSSSSGFKEHDEIIIYLPDKELHYKVFAALSYGNEHILFNYDFSRKRMRNAFFDTIFGGSKVGRNINEDNFSSDKNGVVILSTCLRGNNDKRYIVLAQLVDELS